MLKRHLLRKWGILLACLLALGACRGLGANSISMPTPIATHIVAEKPTFPPTFTPSPTATPVRTPTLSPTPIPSITPTLTLTIEPVPTDTPTMTSTVTVTWTPDVNMATPSGSATPGGGSGSVGQGCSKIPGAVNMLENGDFEGGRQWRATDGLEVPEGWAPFWKEGMPVEYDPDNKDGYLRPDMGVLRDEPPPDEPPRVLSGSQALRVGGNNKVFDAGIFQQVVVNPGDTLCLTGNAHAWSAHQSNDPHHSKLDTEDDRRNANFLLGIDPTGGTDPWSDRVVWSVTAHLYDTYQSIPGVQAKAENATITVFVRGYTLWRFDHNDLFFDLISLERIEP